MKYLALFLSLSLVACSPKIITKVKQKNDAEVMLKSQEKMILFVENQDMMALPSEVENFKNITQALYNQFGGVTTDLPMFKTTEKFFFFGKEGNLWKVDAHHFKKRTAMVLFDGKNKPIVEYNSEKFPALINQYFSKDIVKKNELLREEFQQKTMIATKLDSVLAISFEPSSLYIKNIINSPLSTGYNPSDKSVKCNGSILTIRYEDISMKKILSFTKTKYQDGRFLQIEGGVSGSEEVSLTQYFYSPQHTLLDSVVVKNKGEVIAKQYFKYLPKSYYIIEEGVTQEMLLDDNFLIFKKNVYNSQGEKISETRYEYDDFGRLIFETTDFNGKKQNTTTYQYQTPQDRLYSRFRMIDAQGNRYENILTKEEGKIIYTNWINGEVNYRYRMNNSDDCQGISVYYDKTGKETSVFVSRLVD